MARKSGKETTPADGVVSEKKKPAAGKMKKQETAKKAAEKKSSEKTEKNAVKETVKRGTKTAVKKEAVKEKAVANRTEKAKTEAVKDTKKDSGKLAAKKTAKLTSEVKAKKVKAAETDSRKKAVNNAKTEKAVAAKKAAADTTEKAVVAKKAAANTGKKAAVAKTAAADTKKKPASKQKTTEEKVVKAAKSIKEKAVATKTAKAASDTKKKAAVSKALKADKATKEKAVKRAKTVETDAVKAPKATVEKKAKAVTSVKGKNVKATKVADKTDSKKAATKAVKKVKESQAVTVNAEIPHGENFTALEIITEEQFGKKIAVCSDEELFTALLLYTKSVSAAKKAIKGKKKVYYISAEFLIGKLLSNNLINLGIYDELKKDLAAVGKNIESIEEVEPEPSLGNGGLGRLAACFIDSIATCGLSGDGIGLNYHYGLFRQVFRRKMQCAEKDTWLSEQSWLNKTDVTFTVKFGDREVTSRLYDIDVVGYGQGTNKLHLFDLETVDESLVKKGIDFDKKAVDKNLTLFLYPDDSDDAGRILRVYQQYFMVSSGAQLILKEMKEKGCDLHKLYNFAVIQINDTHPSMVIPELIRILTEQEGFTMNEAINVVSKTCAYTNHTILAEALEKWPIAFLEEAVPQLVPIIRELAQRVEKKYKKTPEVWIIDDTDRVHMAHMDIHYGFSVNGVAALHTEILKNKELNAFYQIYPKKFNNKTNGITFRRWLLSCNPELAYFLTQTIGDGYLKDAGELEKLMEYRGDKAVLDTIEAIKRLKKLELCEYIKKKEKVKLDPDSIFDIQIKRMHEYKRQQMNALYIIHKYLEIKAGKKPVRPMTFIFGAKAAPAYRIAQDIIHLLLVLQEIVNKDPEVNRYMKLVFVENYNVSYAEKLIPACDISEQISLASQEASGTGNMKFMLNGAVTLGTDDGANVEIHDLVGDDNIFIFGKKSDEVLKLRENYNAKYHADRIYAKDPVIKEAVDFIISEQVMKLGNKKCLERLYKEIIGKDWFMALLDVKAYIKEKDKAFKAYENRKKWKQMMLTNIAKAGFFSSDRTILDYNRDIWHLK